ncbi:MAG TPA: pyridoxal 5'-phosphate synthase glutaminase subunit PdxT [Acidimicrobiales bacterium]|nr:pyridoxal 5'-phosphate synthase glutaminase subunit PdxT [Acidimicrobiales bacterium]
MDIGILALQGDVAEHSAALSEIGVAPRRVRRPEDLSGLDGIILPGGESTTMSMLLESSGLADPLGKELAAGLPAMGTCAGMILLGTHAVDGRSDQRCFGAIDITVRRNGFGRQLESFECDLDVSALPGGPLRAVFIRAPLVETSGPAVEVLATVEQPGGAQAGVGDTSLGAGRMVPVLCRKGAVLVAAFHPELTADRRLHRLFASMVEDDRMKRTELPRTESSRTEEGR